MEGDRKEVGKASAFAALLREVTGRIQEAQNQAILAVNAELVRLYWDIGRIIDGRQEREGWGRAVIPRLAKELKNELPEVKGFSERNIARMVAFFRAYPEASPISPQPVAKLPASLSLEDSTAFPTTQAMEGIPSTLLWSLPWAHHVILLQKVKDLGERRWYMEQALANGWSRNVLELQIDSSAHSRAGKAVTNFATSLPSPQSDMAQDMLKDPYVFDFLTLAEPFQERELETELLRHLQKFLLELGQGFAFVGRQYRLDVGDDDFYLDLLFYHLHLRAFIVIDLKRGKFKPEYAGKLNFYCNVINERLKHPTDAPTIGLLLCQTKNELVAEYSVSGIDKPIGISTYEMTRALPKHLRSALPTVDELETELKGVEEPTRRKTTSKK